MKYSIGVDCGSTMCKIALTKDNEILDVAKIKTGWQPKETAKTLIEQIITKNNIKYEDVRIISTGYGRESIDFADKSITEITAHAIGGVYLNPNINAVIDIGGQDSKIIKIENKKCTQFLMNDKCAAGTGRFLEMALDKLEIPIDNLDSFVTEDKYVPINSMCAVFAESEIISLLALNTDRSKILKGVVYSIATKISNMVLKIQKNKDDIFLLTGGLSKSPFIVKVISETINHKVLVTSNSQYAGAIGASIKNI